MSKAFFSSGRVHTGSHAPPPTCDYYMYALLDFLEIIGEGIKVNRYSSGISILLSLYIHM